MDGSTPHRRSRKSTREQGFVLIEAVIAVVLIGLCVGTIVSAIVAIGHQRRTAQPPAALTLAAQNVLADLRAASAYDPVVLAALAGRSTTFDISEPGPSGIPLALHVHAQFAQAVPNAAVIASITVSNAVGQSVSVQSPLVYEAPAPRSIVPARFPPPDTAGTTPGPIPL